MHPQARVPGRMVERTRGNHGHTGITRQSPRKGVTAYFVFSPGTGLFCHRRCANMVCLNPVGPTRLRQLDARVGAPERHVFTVRSNPASPKASPGRPGYAKKASPGIGI